SLGLAQKRLNIINDMEEGVVPQIDKLKAQQDVHDLKSELDLAQLQLPQARSAEQEAQNRMKEQELTFRSDAASELSKQRLEQASVIQQLKAGKDKVTRTEVRSPVRGTIKEIKIRTIGGVINPGEALMAIVPVDGTLLREATHLAS